MSDQSQATSEDNGSVESDRAFDSDAAESGGLLPMEHFENAQAFGTAREDAADSHEAWSLLLDEEWKSKFRAQLQERMESGAAQENVTSKLVNSQIADLTDKIIDLVFQLGKITSTILRICPSSGVNLASRDIRVVLLALALKFKLNGATLNKYQNSWPIVLNEALLDFLREFDDKLSAKTKRVRSKSGISSQTLEEPRVEMIVGPLVDLLVLLASGMRRLSAEFDYFLAHMKVAANEEFASIRDSVLLFEENLVYWAKSSKTIGGANFSSIYTHELMLEIRDHVEDILDGLSKLTETGLPNLEIDFKEAQRVAQTESLAIITVSIFLTSVTASTLGYSFQQKSKAFDAVNFFWFCSLVFSIASVMNSLLAYSWKHSVYRKRFPEEEQLPRFISFWSRETPLLFLLTSAVFFSVGLCIFAYASGQSTWTSTVTTVLTGLTALGIAAATTWFIFEDVTFSSLLERYRTKVATAWSDFTWSATSIPRNMKRKILYKLRSKTPRVLEFYRKFKGVVMALGQSVRWLSKPIVDATRTCAFAVSDAIKGIVKRVLTFLRRIHLSPFLHLRARDGSSELDLGQLEASRTTNFTDNEGQIVPSTDAELSYRPSSAIDETHGSSATPIGFASSVNSVNVAKRWRNLAHTSPMNRLIATFDTVKPRLLDNVNQPINSVSFSTHGEFMALCCDFYFQIYSTRSLNLIADNNLFDGTNKILSKIIWCGSGFDWDRNQFLVTTKECVLLYGIKIYGNDLVLNSQNRDTTSLSIITSYPFNFDLRHHVFVTWVPNEAAFVTVNGTIVEKVSIDVEQGRRWSNIQLPPSDLRDADDQHFSVQDVLSVGGKPRLIIAATISTSYIGIKAGGQSLKIQTMFIVYDVDAGVVESYTSIFDGVIGMSVSKDESLLIVGFRNKSPQLWHIDGNEDDSAQKKLLLSPQRVYDSKLLSYFESCRGQPFFCGLEDEFIVCYDHDYDEIHVWDRQFAIPLYRFGPGTPGLRNIDVPSYQFGPETTDFRSMDVSHAHNGLVLMTGNLGGDAHIWRAAEIKINDDQQILEVPHIGEEKRKKKRVHFAE